jgi:transposase
MKTKTSKTVIGIDLGDKKHAVCILGKGGDILKEISLPNTRMDLELLAKEFPRARVAMETGTHSPWVSRLLAALGMEVLVANARKLRAIYSNERKCDELDARMLARIARVDPALLSPVRHGSEDSQKELLAIKLRDTLVRQRCAVSNAVRASLKALGVILPSRPSTSCFARHARAALADHPDLLATVEPCLAVLDELSLRIRGYDKGVTQTVTAKYPQAGKLQEIPGVGPVTSLCFVLTVEEPARFGDARDVADYLGLVPRRDQSGSSDKQLPISKAGNRYLRTLLVQSAQYILGRYGPESDLRSHGLKLAARGGKAAKKKAVVAVARKLAVLMLTLWRNQQTYEPLHKPRQKAA